MILMYCFAFAADSATLAEMHTEIAACLSVEFPGQFLVLNCSANSGFHVADDTSVMGWIGGLFMPAVHAQHKTRDGIDTGGDRLVAEIEAVLYRLPTVDKLSFFGHSLGGVYCRFVPFPFTPDLTAIYSINFVQLCCRSADGSWLACSAV
jgi:hypothetical protein